MPVLDYRRVCTRKHPVILPLWFASHMLVHDRFVFIHNQKCGGVFVRETLGRELGAAVRQHAFRHAGWSEIPAAARGLPVLCYVRNPWDWYVSWYQFKRQCPSARGPLFDLLSDRGEYDFRRTVQNACELRGFPSCLPEGRIVARDPTVDRADVCTTAFLYSVGAGLDSSLLTVGRFESLVEDLQVFLSRAGVELPDGAVAHTKAGASLNASERGHYRDYYDAELRDTVGESCMTLIERFGYSF